MKEKLKAIFAKPIWSDYRLLFGVWVLIAVFPWLKQMGYGEPENTFDIFRYVYLHAIQHLPLYPEYPAEYMDSNHYGPFFIVFVAPFAMLPLWVGYLMWQLLMSLSLYFAVRASGLPRWRQVFVLWFCAQEMLTCLFVAQFNGVIAAIILMTFVFVEKEKDHWATLMILIGTFIKLYGIVGLAFFLFSKHKTRFILSFALWSLVLFVAPMIVTGPEYVLQEYVGWYDSLMTKNGLNQFAMDENICLLGMVRKFCYFMTCTDFQHFLSVERWEVMPDPECWAVAYSDLWLIVPGLALFALPYLRWKQYGARAFRELFLASVMMFVCLFSTGTESYGYIIALTGVVIWYTAVPDRGRWDLALLVFAFVLTSMSTTDAFPPVVRHNIIKPFALKALPIVVIWLRLTYELLTRDFTALKDER